MPIYEFNGKKPRIHEAAFIAPNATIIGDVEIELGAGIWYNAVIRADMAPIRIGKNSNVQDNCTVHTDYGKPTTIGQYVTVGHNAVLHGCTVEDCCLIGIRSVLLNNSIIRKNSIVAAGAVVMEKSEFGPNQMIIGMPAEVKKELSKETLEAMRLPAEIYVALAADHAAIMRK